MPYFLHDEVRNQPIFPDVESFYLSLPQCKKRLKRYLVRGALCNNLWVVFSNKMLFRDITNVIRDWAIR